VALSVTKANDLATLAVFTRRAVNQEKTVPVRFGDDATHVSPRKRNDGQVIAEFEHDGSAEKITLSTLQLLELEILAQHALDCAFEPVSVTVENHFASEALRAPQVA
jgi:hypothetical protein